MASKVNDRWLWLGLGFFGFFAVKGIAYGLREVVRLTEVKEQVVIPRRVSQETEDGTQDFDHIKLDSLRILSTCSNIEIRKAATRIVCQRFINHPDARRALSEDLNSSDEDVRTRARRAERLLDRYMGGSGWREPDYVDHEPIPLPPNFDADLPDSPGVRSRPQDESPEELAARRRRREAMVLNEGDRPVSQDDIIQHGAGNRATDDDLRRTEIALADLLGLALDPSILNHG